MTMEREKIRVMLVDDHAVVRVGFRMLLSLNPLIEVVGEAENGEQAYHQYPQACFPTELIEIKNVARDAICQTNGQICQPVGLR